MSCGSKRRIREDYAEQGIGSCQQRIENMITAKQFSQAFERASHEQQVTLLQCWPSQPKLTHYIKHQMMPAIAEDVGCSLELEYKRIDIVSRPPPGPESDVMTIPKIVAAIEHENNFGGSDSEVRKLRMLPVPLGVLITYVSVPRRRQQLVEFAKLLAAVSSESVPLGEMLLIIGPYGMKAPANLEWEYFVFREREFEQIAL